MFTGIVQSQAEVISAITKDSLCRLIISVDCEHINQLENDIVGYLQKHNKIEVANIKQMFGYSRKHAIPVLEYLDKKGITVRVGNTRTLK